MAGTLRPLGWRRSRRFPPTRTAWWSARSALATGSGFDTEYTDNDQRRGDVALAATTGFEPNPEIRAIGSASTAPCFVIPTRPPPTSNPARLRPSARSTASPARPPSRLRQRRQSPAPPAAARLGPGRRPAPNSRHSGSLASTAPALAIRLLPAPTPARSEPRSPPSRCATCSSRPPGAAAARASFASARQSGAEHDRGGRHLGVILGLSAGPTPWSTPSTPCRKRRGPPPSLNRSPPRTSRQSDAGVAGYVCSRTFLGDPRADRRHRLFAAALAIPGLVPDGEVGRPPGRCRFLPRGSTSSRPACSRG